MAKRTGLIWHELFMWHQQGVYSGLVPAGFPVQPGQHYETAEGKRRIKNLMDAAGFTAKLVAVEPRPASDEELARVHSQDYLVRLADANRASQASAGPQAPFMRGSFDIARLAAGGTIAAVDRIISGDIDNGYLLARPPGHHAERDGGMGFCLLNNCAVGVAHAQAAHGLERIAIVDVDVHHGNGAESIFWSDPRVLTISIHQDNWFPPDSGGIHRVGEGMGVGFNINVPLPAGCGFGAYKAAFDQVILPALDSYRPQMLFVPFGVDAGAQDPLGRMILSSNGFRWISAQLAALADRHCTGQMLVSHEGGYNEATSPFMSLAIIETISGIASGVVDPYAEFMDKMSGHRLLPHQEAAIDAAVPAIARLESALELGATM